MRKKLTLFLAITLTVPVMVLAPIVAAHEGADDTPTSSDTQPDDSNGLTEAQKQELHDRLEKKKEEFSVKLEAFQQKLLKLKCRPAQTVVSTVSDRINARSSKRQDIYANLQEKLKTLIAKLQAAHVDTGDLENAISTLETKITTLKTDVEADKAALNDLKNVDCESDPDAFQAALEAARTAHKQVMDDAADVRAYAKDTLKPILVQLKQQLKDKASSMEGDQ